MFLFGEDESAGLSPPIGPLRLEEKKVLCRALGGGPAKVESCSREDTAKPPLSWCGTQLRGRRGTVSGISVPGSPLC